MRLFWTILLIVLWLIDLVIASSYIVTFNHYDQSINLSNIISESLSQSNTSNQSFRIIERHNPASKFPTDFLVIDDLCEECISQLKQLKQVRLVQRQTTYRHLLSVKQPSIKDQSTKHHSDDHSTQHINLPNDPSHDDLIHRSVDHLGRVRTHSKQDQSSDDPFSQSIEEHRRRYFEYDNDPLNVGSFALPRRFSTNMLINDDDDQPINQSIHHSIDRSHYNSTPLEPLNEAHDQSTHRRRLKSVNSSVNQSTSQSSHLRSLKSINPASISVHYEAQKLWDQGFTGQNVRVAIFDTGLALNHPHFKRIVDRSDWTDNDTCDDQLGHGTHVAGVIAGAADECRGFAPDAEVYVFRVFNTRQLSYTAWFLDAFNYALHTGVDVLNLSIGGPDFLDEPFVDKVRELSANGVIVVSAIGNDGPLYGTLNNPADAMDTLGVGGLTNEGGVSGFSSRGMTTHELPEGYGRVKPDVLALANQVMGSKINGGCRAQTGTSVASPVVAGAVTLLASTIKQSDRSRDLNPARLKQALVGSAVKLADPHVFEQGMGRLNVIGAHRFLLENPPHVSAIPPALDLTDCPYMWPYCVQPLFHTQMPVLVNLTVLNSISSVSVFEHLHFQAVPLGAAAQRQGKAECDRDLLSITFSHSDPIWPWAGYLALSISVVRDVRAACRMKGEISALIRSSSGSLHTLVVPLTVGVISRPAREKRLLWDQVHNLRYPSGYFPRDNLEVKTDTLDWNGDHPHTNFKSLFNSLIAAGYFLDVLGRDYSCFDASAYSTLLIVDPEEEFLASDISKLRADVADAGLSVLVFADWYNLNVMREIKFYDENTASWWTPVTGGANLPALNDLLEPFGFAFSHHVLKGRVNVSGEFLNYASGTSIARAPAASRLGYVELNDAGSGSQHLNYPVLALMDSQPQQKGRIALFGDSNCIDENNQHGALCLHLIHDMLRFTSFAELTPKLSASLNDPLTSVFVDPSVAELPQRMKGSNLATYSRMLKPGRVSQCDADYQVIEILNPNATRASRMFSTPSDQLDQSFYHVFEFDTPDMLSPSSRYAWTRLFICLMVVIVLSVCSIVYSQPLRVWWGLLRRSQEDKELLSV